MSKTKMFLLDYINRKTWAYSKREYARDVVSVGFNMFHLSELKSLDSGEYEDLLYYLQTIKDYALGHKMTIDEIQMVLARFARELKCSDLEPDLIHELNDDAWAVIDTLDYIKSLEELKDD